MNYSRWNALDARSREQNMVTHPSGNDKSYFCKVYRCDKKAEDCQTYCIDHLTPVRTVKPCKVTGSTQVLHTKGNSKARLVDPFKGQAERPLATLGDVLRKKAS